MAVAASLLALGGSTPARCADVGGADGWNVSVSGLINAFVVHASWEVGNDQEETTRVMSGFNPAKLNFARLKNAELVMVGREPWHAQGIQATVFRFRIHGPGVNELALRLPGVDKPLTIGSVYTSRELLSLLDRASHGAQAAAR